MRGPEPAHARTAPRPHAQRAAERRAARRRGAPPLIPIRTIRQGPQLNSGDQERLGSPAWLGPCTEQQERVTQTWVRTGLEVANLLLVTESRISSLIRESQELERRASRIQGDRSLLATDDEISELVVEYHGWYARALDILPGEYIERFRAEFDGSIWANKIKSFLDAPGDVSPLFNASEPSPLFPYWSRPFDSSFRVPLLAQRQILTEARQQLEGAGKYSEDIALLERVFRNIRKLFRELENRSQGRDPFAIRDEYDLQDVVRGLLRMFFDDVRPEDFSPDRAGARSRIDFVLKSERIVIETKMTRRTLGKKDVAEELIVDIERYKGHPDCGALIALVYDPEHRIDNPHGFERDLTRKHDGLMAYIYVVQ